MLNTLAWTLIHFLWQGTLLALLFALAQRLVAPSSSRGRYAVAAVTMLAMPVCALATFLYLAPSAATAAAPFAIDGPLAATIAQGRQAAQSMADSGRDYLSWLCYAWMAGVLLLSLRMLGQWTILQRYRRIAVRPVQEQWERSAQRLAKRLQLSRPIRLFESAIADVPAVVGWLRPVILLPVSALTQLTPVQVEALLAHELAHILRHDYLINLLQTSVETLFFYHPAVWWVARCMRQEREHCCDDIAVQVCGDPVVYARALADLEQLRFQMPSLAMAANGGSLLKRIERIILPQPARTAPAALWLTTFGLLAASLVVWATPALSVSNNVLDFVELAEQAAPAPAPAPKPVPQAKPAPQAKAAAPGASQDSGSFLDNLERAGLKDLTVDQMVALKIHNVNGDFIQSIRAEGYSPTTDQLVALRIHNVTPEFIHEMKALGWSPTIDQLIALRIHSVEPASLSAMKQLGYELKPDEAIAMKIHGLTPETARSLNGLGFGKASFDQLIALRIHNVDPEFASSWKQLGVQGLDMDKLIALRIHNATASEVKAVEALGYPGLTADNIIAMRIFGITPDFIREAQKRGFKDLTFDRLVRLKQFGLLDKQ